MFITYQTDRNGNRINEQEHAYTESPHYAVATASEQRKCLNCGEGMLDARTGQKFCTHRCKTEHWEKNHRFKIVDYKGEIVGEMRLLGMKGKF
jgi:hypothetical protein